MLFLNFKYTFLYISQNLHTSDSMVSLCYRALHNYISENNLEGLQGFLENRRVLVDDRDDVRYNLINIFLYFVYIHTFFQNGATALHYAAIKGKLQFLRELINHGSDVNIEDNVSIQTFRLCFYWILQLNRIAQHIKQP